MVTTQLHEVNERSFTASRTDTLTFVFKRSRIDTLISLKNRLNDTFVLRTSEEKIGFVSRCLNDTIKEQTTLARYQVNEQSNPLMAERKKGGRALSRFNQTAVFLLFLIIFCIICRYVKKK